MNIIELTNIIKDYAISLRACNSVTEGDVHVNLNSNEIQYGNVNIYVESVTNEEYQSVYTVILYYTDRLLQDKSNSSRIYTDGFYTLQSIINYLNKQDYIDIDEEVNYTPFEEQFADYLAGLYTQVDIRTINNIGICNMDNYYE